MLPERRYADWRPVAVRRVPAEWIGIAAGSLVALVLWVAIGSLNYLSFVAFGFVAHWAKSHLAERRMKDLRDDAEGGQFAVNLRLSREVGYGFDEGLVAFEAGWLVYSGRRCAFSIRRVDVLDVTLKDKRHGFDFRGEAGRHTTTFLTAEDGRFGKAFGEWIRAEGVSGDAVLPPTRPNEEARTLHRSWPWIGGLLTVLVLGIAFLSHRSGGRMVELAFAALALPISLLYGIVAQRALGRLGKGLPYRRDFLDPVFGIRVPCPTPMEELELPEAKTALIQAVRKRREEGLALQEWTLDADGVLRQDAQTRQ